MCQAKQMSLHSLETMLNDFERAVNIRFVSLAQYNEITFSEVMK